MIILSEAYHKYDCVLLKFSKNAHNNLEFFKELQIKIPRENLYIDPRFTNTGLEKDPHITVLYGIIDREGYRKTYNAAQRILKRPINATVGMVSIFERPDYDVLKVEIHSNDLRKFNEFLYKNVKNEWDFPDYSPHITLAYIKKGTCKNLVGRHRFYKQKILFDRIDYSCRQGFSLTIDLKSILLNIF